MFFTKEKKYDALYTPTKKLGCSIQKRRKTRMHDTKKKTKKSDVIYKQTKKKENLGYRL